MSESTSEIDELYQKVSDIYSRDEFEEMIDEKKEKYDDFFNERAIAKMIMTEEGRNESALTQIGEVEPGETYTLEGEIIDLGTLRTFEKDSGEGRVRNVRIDDGTGTIKVVFWDEDTERVEEEFEIDTRLKVINGRVEDKGYGKQISAGKWGEVVVVGEGKKD